jgi:HlyD family secretion protein
MNPFASRDLSQKLPALLAAGLLCIAIPRRGRPDAPKGAAVTVLKATKSCFASIVEATGIVIPRETGTT